MKKIELLMDSVALDRALSRIAHEIIEKNPDLKSLGFVGMQTRGVFLAKRICDKIEQLEGLKSDYGVLDVTLYRDDYRNTFKQPAVKVTDIPYNINDKNIILVDDVLYTGRTVRAALDALMDLGRPRAIRLVVMVDRGHRELPIRADFIGKKMTTQKNHIVDLHVKEIDSDDSLWLMELEEGD